MAPVSSAFRNSRLWPAIAALTVAALGYSQSVKSPAKPTVDYDRDVHAILADHCLVCHNAEKRSGGLSLGTYAEIMTGGKDGAAIQPGNSGQSLMVRRIMGEVAPAMPLGLDPLSLQEIATLRTWIDEGARATPTSAMGKARWDPPLALSEPPVPAITWPEWTRPLDRFTSAYLARQGVAKPTPVDQAEFARRVYLDIWGLLPTPEQIREFIASPNPAKREKLIASLMDNPTRYSEHWISWWNDLLRNDEGVVYYSETAQRKSITPWLLDALQKNKPYNQMVKELLNPSMPGDPDGFLIGVNWRGTTSASQTPAMQASQNSAQIFVGINFKCNSCHDSFISKWKLKDAYALAAYFSSEEKLQLYRCDVAQPDQFATAAYMYPEINRPLPSATIADRRSTVAGIFTDPRNGRFARTFVNRIWERLMGHGIVGNVDDLDGEPWSPELLDYLASDFVKNGYDIRHLISIIVGSNTYQMRTVARPGGPPKEYSFRGPELRRITAEQFADAIASVTGDWHVARQAAAAPVPGAAVLVAAATGGAAAAVSTAVTAAIADAPKVLGAFSGAPVDTEANLALNNRPATPAPAPAPGRGGSPSAPTPAAPTPVAVRVTPPPPPVAGGSYAREWKIAGSSFTRAMGRPIRDQVYTTRDTQATTMQAVELVNGETLNHWVWRGAQRMLGELPPEPASLFSRQVAGTVSRGTPSPAATTPTAPDYIGWMTIINASSRLLLAAVQSKDVAKATNEAVRMAEAFDSVLKYWTEKKAEDAIALAQTARDAAKTIAVSKDASVQDEALTTLLNTCGQCHTAHRMPGAPGQTFAISADVLPAGGVASGPVLPPVPFTIDVSKSTKLYLIVEDNLSTAPDKAAAIWRSAVFTSAGGVKTPLASLRPIDTNGLRDDNSPVIPLGGDKDKPVADALRVKFPSVLVYDISNRGFETFEGIPTFENITLAQGETVVGRFFIFDQPPGMDRLAPPAGEPPVPPQPPIKTAAEAVDRVYWYLLGRAPSIAERRVAITALRDPKHPDRPSPTGLADLLWSVLMSPEFQFIR